MGVELNPIPRPNPDAPEGTVEDLPNGVRVIRHALTKKGTLESYIQPDGEILILFDGHLLLDVRPSIEDEPDS
jgi:hypothetical protein